MAQHEDVALVGEAEQRLQCHGRGLEGGAVVAVDVVGKRRQAGCFAAHQGRRELLGEMLDRDGAGEALERLVPGDAVVAMDRQPKRQQGGEEQDDRQMQAPAHPAPPATAPQNLCTMERS